MALSPSELAAVYTVTDTDRWPLTPRTRFGLWLGLTEVSWRLTSTVWSVLDGAPVREDDLVSRLPPEVLEQPIRWWGDLLSGGQRLKQAAAAGDLDELTPRTVGEEIILYLGIGLAPEQLELAESLAGEYPNRDLWQLYNDLPRVQQIPLPDDLGDLSADEMEDHEWPEILPFLTGSTDTETVFSSDWEDLLENAHSTRRELGIDVRLAGWNTLDPSPGS